MVPGNPPNVPGVTITDVFNDMEVCDTNAIALCPITSITTSGPIRIYFE